MNKAEQRLYNDLAWLWPLWEDISAYQQESELITGLIKEHAEIEVNTLLDVGCGSGKNAFWLKKHFAITGIDISEHMIKNAKKLNPECIFQIGDMRDFNLNAQYDSAFLNDSIVYMATKDDLIKTFKNVYDHLETGGVMICFAEVTKESFKQNSTSISKAQSEFKPASIEITFIENSYDSDPEDDNYQLTFVYLIRKEGKLRIEHDTHICGLFSLDFWRTSLEGVGFKVHEKIRRVDTSDMPVFICLKS